MHKNLAAAVFRVAPLERVDLASQLGDLVHPEPSSEPRQTVAAETNPSSHPSGEEPGQGVGGGERQVAKGWSGIACAPCFIWR